MDSCSQLFDILCSLSLFSPQNKVESHWEIVTYLYNQETWCWIPNRFRTRSKVKVVFHESLASRTLNSCSPNIYIRPSNLCSCAQWGFQGFFSSRNGPHLGGKKCPKTPKVIYLRDYAIFFYRKERSRKTVRFLPILKCVGAPWENGTGFSHLCQTLDGDRWRSNALQSR